MVCCSNVVFSSSLYYENIACSTTTCVLDICICGTLHNGIVSLFMLKIVFFVMQFIVINVNGLHSVLCDVIILPQNDKVNLSVVTNFFPAPWTTNNSDGNDVCKDWLDRDNNDATSPLLHSII